MSIRKERQNVVSKIGETNEVFYVKEYRLVIPTRSRSGVDGVKQLAANPFRRHSYWAAMVIDGASVNELGRKILLIKKESE
ncbi:hypothetical protein ACB087_19250 [Vibrio sp. VNB-15]